MKKLTASLISAVLVLLAPGLPAYAAGASVVRPVPAANASLGGNAAAVRLGAPTSLPSSVSPTGSLTLGSSLPGVTLSAPFQDQSAGIQVGQATGLAAQAALPAALPVPGTQASAPLLTPQPLPPRLLKERKGPLASPSSSARKRRFSSPLRKHPP
ncbi:MAG: hypothetical protein WC943_01410 [Elusimicrobiota bacterium]